VLEPHSIRTHLLAILVTIRLQSASVLENTFSLARQISLVIDRQRICLPYIFFGLRAYDSPRVPDIGAINMVLDDHTYHCSTA
jgi:hypothetical protein